MPNPRRAATIVLLALAAASCGGGDDEAATGDATTAPPTTGAPTSGTAADEGTTATTGAAPADTGTTAAPAGELPPLESLTEDNLEGLQEVFDPLLADLDLVVTRGGVVEYRGGSHLQLYVEPTTGEADNTPQVFLDRMLTSFQAIIPNLFDAYPGMDSFDLCQEPVPPAGEIQPDYEEPVTLLLLTRAGFESVDDWGAATLADLFDAAAEERDGYTSVSPAVAELPDYQAATAG